MRLVGVDAAHLQLVAVDLHDLRRHVERVARAHVEPHEVIIEAEQCQPRRLMQRAQEVAREMQAAQQLALPRLVDSRQHRTTGLHHHC